MFTRSMFVRISLTTVLLVAAVRVAVMYAPVPISTFVPMTIDSPAPAGANGQMVVFPLANFDVQGHRGARGLKPENTLPAFETALDLGVDTLDLDLRLTADDRLVIWHDSAIDSRKCGLDPAVANPTAPDPDYEDPASPALLIRHLTLAQIQEYRCDRNPDAQTFTEQNNEPTLLAGDAYGIVTLDALFDFVAFYGSSGRKSDVQRQQARLVRFNVETMRSPEDPDAIGDDFDGQRPGTLERELVAVVRDYRLLSRVTVQSFDHRSLWAIGKIAPQLRLAALVDEPPSIADLTAKGSSLLLPEASLVTRSLLEQAHAQGVKVVPWTVNEVEEMQRLITMGVDGLVTDRPDLFLALERGALR